MAGMNDDSKPRRPIKNEDVSIIACTIVFFSLACYALVRLAEVLP